MFILSYFMQFPNNKQNFNTLKKLLFEKPQRIKITVYYFLPLKRRSKTLTYVCVPGVLWLTDVKGNIFTSITELGILFKKFPPK